jgi:hypothetical protein
MRLRQTREAAADAYVAGSDGLEDATDREEMELLGASGVTIIMISAALGGPTTMKGMEPNHPPDTEKVEAVRARVRRRRCLGLQHRDCLRRDCACGALTDTLDELDKSATKDAILRAARGLHKSRVSRAAKATHNAARAYSRRHRERDVNQALPRRPPTPEMVGDGPRGTGGIMEKVFLNGQRRKENQMTDTTDTDGVRPTPFPNRFQHCSNPRG